MIVFGLTIMLLKTVKLKYVQVCKNWKELFNKIYNYSFELMLSYLFATSNLILHREQKKKTNFALVKIILEKTNFALVKIILDQGFSNFFGWRPTYLFLEILQPFICKISHKRPFIWELFSQLELKNFQFHCLATLFWKLATLKRVCEP